MTMTTNPAPGSCPASNGIGACRAGAVGHRGRHDCPGDGRCYFYRHSYGVPPRRCLLADGHEVTTAHEYDGIDKLED